MRCIYMVELAIGFGLMAAIWFGRSVIKDSADGLDESAKLWRDEKVVEVALQRQELYKTVQDEMTESGLTKLATSEDVYKLIGYSKKR